MKLRPALPFILFGILIGLAPAANPRPADPPPDANESRREVRRDIDVFKKWMPVNQAEIIQQVYSDVRLAAVTPYSNNYYPQLVIETYNKNASIMADDNGLLQSIYSRDFKKTEGPAFSIDRATKKTLSEIYQMMDGNIPRLFSYLGKLGLNSSALNEKERMRVSKEVRLKYTTILEMLLAGSSQYKTRECTLAAANRLVEYCFGVDTWPAFEKIMDADNTRPLSRFAYSIIWYYLSGVGWKHWHAETLKGLKKEFDAGSRIIYIAGGNDVYQFIKAGIYDIEVIDPLLPSQPRFYADGWEFLFKNKGIGDEIILNFDGNPKQQTKHPHLVMRRAKYEPGETFTALLNTGNSEKIPGSKTTWVIFDRDTGRRLGSLIINRRFCNQNDFISGKGRTLVMSFNELFFVATPDASRSWGINPEKFSHNFKLYVKQLRKPVSKGMILNIRKGEQNPNRLLSLGSEVN
jgi:hypothetical protein